MNETESMLYNRLNNQLDDMQVTMQRIEVMHKDHLSILKEQCSLLDSIGEKRSIIEQADENIIKLIKEKHSRQRREELEQWQIRKAQKVFFFMSLYFTAYMFINMELWLCRGYRNKNISDS